MLLLLAINGAVFWNGLRHDPRIGYDAPDHLEYARSLASGRIPDPEKTRQSYVPPLPYVVTAVTEASLGVDTVSAARVGLLAQGVLSLGLGLLLLVLCERLRPGDDVTKIAALLFLGMPAAYYRTFAMLRGEPYLAFLTALSILLVLRVLDRRGFSWAEALGLGLCWCLLGLSRHWGFLVIGAEVFVLISIAAHQRPQAAALGATILVGLAVMAPPAAWFYQENEARQARVFYGKLRRPNAEAERGRLGAGWPHIVRRPIRPAFRDEPLAVLYADWWGDYHLYFSYRGDRRSADPDAWCLAGAVLAAHAPVGFRGIQTNLGDMAPYLGRVNLLAVLPTLVLAGGLVLGSIVLVRVVILGTSDPRSRGLALLAAIVLATLGAHAVLIGRVGLGGAGRDLLKASYDLQVLPALALLGADLQARLWRRWRLPAGVLLGCLLAIWIHGYGAAFSRWPEPLACTPRGWEEPRGQAGSTVP